MKKLLLFGALLMGGAITDTHAQNFSLGLRAGANFSSFSTEAAHNTEEGKAAAESYKDMRRALAGVQAGVVSNYAFNDVFSIQPELLYSTKGYKTEGEVIPGFKQESKLLLNYIELPILAKASFGSDDVKVSVLAGPYVGYLVSGKQTFKQNGQVQSEEDLNFEYSDTQGEKFQHVDVGAAIGASLGYKTGTGTWMLDVRYNYGLANINEYQVSGPLDVEIYNRTFSVSIGWLFHFGDSTLKPKPLFEKPVFDEAAPADQGTNTQPGGQ